MSATTLSPCAEEPRLPVLPLIVSTLVAIALANIAAAVFSLVAL